MNDLQIIEMYWKRNEQAISVTAEKYGTYCYSIAYGVLHNEEDSKESVNDTYMSAWNSMPPHKPNVLKTFLGKITRRLSIDKLKRKNAEKRGGEIEMLKSVAVKLQRCWTSYRNVFLQAVIR